MFITFEGVEGAGKSTQARMLGERLCDDGLRVLRTREPGDGPLGASLRSLVLTPPDGVDVADRAELFIMLADRAQHVSAVIRPALADGVHVLCDRYVDSSVAYQGFGRGLDVAHIEALNHFATDGLMPDVTVLIDLDPALGLARQANRNRMEEESMDFHQRVRDGFLNIVVRSPARFLVVDGSLSPSELQTCIWSGLSAFFTA